MCVFAFSSSLNIFCVCFHSYCVFVHSFFLQSVAKKEKVCAFPVFLVVLYLKLVCIYIYNAPNVCSGQSPGDEYENSEVTAIIDHKKLDGVQLKA